MHHNGSVARFAGEWLPAKLSHRKLVLKYKILSDQQIHPCEFCHVLGLGATRYCGRTRPMPLKYRCKGCAALPFVSKGGNAPARFCPPFVPPLSCGISPVRRERHPVSTLYPLNHSAARPAGSAAHGLGLPGQLQKERGRPSSRRTALAKKGIL